MFRRLYRKKSRILRSYATNYAIVTLNSQVRTADMLILLMVVD